MIRTTLTKVEPAPTGTEPMPGDGPRLIDPDALLIADGKPVGFYISRPEWVAELHHLADNPEWNRERKGTTVRAPGRKAMKKLSPPMPWSYRADFMKVVERWYPEQLELAHKLAVKAYDDPTPWGTVAVKPNAVTHYHTDAPSFRASFTLLIYLRRGEVRGGHIVLPDYGVRFPCLDGHMMFFHGAWIKHGVTPLSLDSEGAYRTPLLLWAGAYNQETRGLR